MQFILKPTYRDWPENPRKTLHVDAEAMAAIREGEPLPTEIVEELKNPMYHQGLGRLAGMTIEVDLDSKRD